MERPIYIFRATIARMVKRKRLAEKARALKNKQAPLPEPVKTTPTPTQEKPKIPLATARKQGQDRKTSKAYIGEAIAEFREINRCPILVTRHPVTGENIMVSTVDLNSINFPKGYYANQRDGITAKGNTKSGLWDTTKFYKVDAVQYDTLAKVVRKGLSEPWIAEMDKITQNFQEQTSLLQKNIGSPML